jgi:hypothetical protein
MITHGGDIWEGNTITDVDKVTSFFKFMYVRIWGGNTKVGKEKDNVMDAEKLSQELKKAGISTHGNCNSDGVVWDDDNREIQNRPEVAAIINNLDNVPDEVIKTDKEIIAELQAQVTLLAKAVNKIPLSSEEASTLDSIAGGLDA